MEILIFNNEQYEAEKIVKTSDSIVGLNGQSEVFAFRGISDFSLFVLEDGHEFDVQDDGFNYLIDLDFRLSMIELGIVGDVR